MDKVNEAYWRGYHNGYACAMEDNAKLTIVRCKDCKHREVQVDGVFRYEMCGIRNEIINLNGFCHMGKKRENAETKGEVPQGGGI